MSSTSSNEAAATAETETATTTTTKTIWEFVLGRAASETLENLQRLLGAKEAGGNGQGGQETGLSRQQQPRFRIAGADAYANATAAAAPAPNPAACC